MPYAIDFAPKAAVALSALPPKIRRQVARRVDLLAAHPRAPDSKKLQGLENLYRVRSGDYRIVYQIQDKKLLVLVVRIGNRRDVYHGP